MLPIPRAGLLRKVSGKEDALAVPGIEDIMITAELGEKLVPLPEGTRYLGFMIARADTAAEAEASLREAYARLTFLIDDAPGTTPTQAKDQVHSEVRSIRF